MRNRRSVSVTPTPGDESFSTVIGGPADPIDLDSYLEEDRWGDDAMLAWDGAIDVGSSPNLQADRNVIDILDSASSVAPGDAGIDSDEDEDWGREAVMDWAWSATQEKKDASPPDTVEGEEESEVEEVIEPKVETESELKSRGMPDYGSWDLKKLQVSSSIPKICS